MEPTAKSFSAECPRLSAAAHLNRYAKAGSPFVEEAPEIYDHLPYFLEIPSPLIPPVVSLLHPLEEPCPPQPHPHLFSSRNRPVATGLADPGNGGGDRRPRQPDHAPRLFSSAAPSAATVH